MSDARTLLGPDGRPIAVRPKVLSREMAAPIGQVRPAIFEPVASRLTPRALPRVLREAVSSDPREFFELAEEIEERDLHYASVLATRRRAVSQLDIHVHAVDDNSSEEEITAAVRDLTAAPAFIDMLDDALDALGKGYAMTEIMWETGARWTPREYFWRDPRGFVLDEETRRTVLLRVADGEAQPLPFGKFMVHEAKAKAGLPIRSGLARLAAYAFMMKSYTVKDWATFAATYGMPLRLGRHGANATEQEKRALLHAVRSIGNDWAAIVPDGMSMEFVQANTGKGEGVFSGLAEYLDAQMSKLILGQTMTSDDGASLAQAKVHDEVRGEIKIADARRLSASVQRAIIIPFVQLNWGARDRYPVFELKKPETEDVALIADSVAKLVPHGLTISQAELRRRIGFADPESDEPVLGAAAPTEEATTQSQNRAEQPDETRLFADDELEAIAAEELSDWQGQMAPVINPILELAKQSGGYDAFMAGLPTAAESIDPTPLATALATATTKGEIDGEVGERPKRSPTPAPVRRTLDAP